VTQARNGVCSFFFDSDDLINITLRGRFRVSSVMRLRTCHWVARRERLQSEHFTHCLWPDSDAVRDGMPRQRSHRVFVYRISCEVTLLGVPFQQALAFEALAFEKAPLTVGESMRPSREFPSRR